MSILAPVKAYFKYSMELKAHVPTVAYYCKLYAVTKGFELMKQNAQNPNIADVKAYLIGELKDLEVMKGALGQTTKEEHQPMVENFMLSVFAKIDKEERTAEKITKQHAIDFKKCSDLIAVLGMFGPMESEWQEREKYCKFKAGIILKCLKNGEEPPRGNPQAQEEEEDVEGGGANQEDQISQDMQNMSMNNNGAPVQQYEEQKNHFGGGMVTPNPSMMPSYNPIVVDPMSNVSFSHPGQTHQPPVNNNISMSHPGQNPYQASHQQQQPPPSSYSPHMPPPATAYNHQQPTQPQPVAPPSYNPYQPSGGAPSLKPAGSAGGVVKKDAAYYKAIGDAKKKAQNAVSELDFSNINNAVKYFKEALAILQPYENA